MRVRTWRYLPAAPRPAPLPLACSASLVSHTFTFRSLASSLMQRDVHIFNPSQPPPSSDGNPFLMEKWGHLFDSGHLALLAAATAAFPPQPFPSSELSTAKPLFSSAPRTVTNGTARAGISRGNSKTGPFGKHPSFYPRLSHGRKRKQPSQQPKMLTLKDLIPLW